MPVVQRDLAQQLRDQSVVVRHRLADLLRPLDVSRLNEHPGPRGRSVGDVLERLRVGDEGSAGPVDSVMRALPPDVVLRRAMAADVSRQSHRGDAREAAIDEGAGGASAGSNRAP